MVKLGAELWQAHPDVRTGDDLSVGERAADFLKRWFGTWTLLGLVAGLITFWLLVINDPGELHLNLVLSCMAAVQGIILQISANRGDRIDSEVALGTQANTVAIRSLLEENTRLTEQVKLQTDLLDEIHRHVEAMTPRAGSFTAPAASKTASRRQPS